MCQYFSLFCEIYFFECSRGKADQAAGEPVFCVNNPAVFLRKILGLFSMAKRQNFSMQPGPLSHSAFKKTLTVIKNNSRDFYALYFPLTPSEMEIYTIYAHCKLLKRRWVWKFYARERIINSTQWIWREGGRHKSKRLFLGMPRERHYHSFYAPKNV